MSRGGKREPYRLLLRCGTVLLFRRQREVDLPHLYTAAIFLRTQELVEVLLQSVFVQARYDLAGFGAGGGSLAVIPGKPLKSFTLYVKTVATP